MTTPDPDLVTALRSHYARGGALTDDVKRIARGAGFSMAANGGLLFAGDAEALAVIVAKAIAPAT